MNGVNCYLWGGRGAWWPCLVIGDRCALPQLPDGSGSAARFEGRPHESRTRSVGSRAT